MKWRHNRYFFRVEIIFYSRDISVADSGFASLEARLSWSMPVNSMAIVPTRTQIKETRIM